MAGPMLLQGLRAGLRGRLPFVVPAGVAIDAAYQPRNPEESPLYKVVAGHLETFLARQRERDRQVPAFVERDNANSSTAACSGGDVRRTFRPYCEQLPTTDPTSTGTGADGNIRLIPAEQSDHISQTAGLIPRGLKQNTDNTAT